MDRRPNEKAIDFVRRKIADAKQYCTTEKQVKAIDSLLELLSLDDYFFLKVDINNAAEVFRLTGVNTEEAKRLYREMVNPEEYIKFKIYMLCEKIKGIIVKP